MINSLINLLFGGVSISFIIKCIMAIGLGAFVSFSLIISGLAWARSFSNIATYCLLPLIGLVITQVISGDIALSLGMVGALSIIRFRHPVKSPLELSIYFLLLTIGIALTSNPGKAIILVLFSMSIIYIYAFLKNKGIRRSSQFPSLMEVKDTLEYIIDVECSKIDENFKLHPNLLFFYENNSDKNFSYKISFRDRENADKFVSYLKELDHVLEIKFTCL